MPRLAPASRTSVNSSPSAAAARGAAHGSRSAAPAAAWLLLAAALPSAVRAEGLDADGTVAVAVGVPIFATFMILSCWWLTRRYLKKFRVHAAAATAAGAPPSEAEELHAAVKPLVKAASFARTLVGSTPLDVGSGSRDEGAGSRSSLTRSASSPALLAASKRSAFAPVSPRTGTGGSGTSGSGAFSVELPGSSSMDAVSVPVAPAASAAPATGPAAV